MLQYMGDFSINARPSLSVTSPFANQKCIQRAIIPSRFSTVTVMIFALMAVVSVSTSHADTTWIMRDGNMTIHLDHQALSSHGLSVRSMMKGSASNDHLSTELTIANADEIAFLSDQGVVHEWYSHDLTVAGGLRILSRHGSSTVYDFRIISDDFVSSRIQFNFSSVSVSDNLMSPPLELHGFRAGFNQNKLSLTLPVEAIHISHKLAEALGDPHLAGLSIGWLVVQGSVIRENGVRESNNHALAEEIDPVMSSGGEVAGLGGDMTFCQLFDLRQFGRSGSTVGFALATTSWNVGTADLRWFANPSTAHPVIGMNMYRLENDQFFQIGQSWLKHGFFALDSEQCGTACTYEAGHSAGNWLGVGCTDTYGANLNASHSNLGPRYEINPWTGEFVFTGSHLSNSSHSHDGQIDHRIQVDDQDLDQSLHANATYYAEGYYIVSDDGNHMNNAAWKPIGVAGVAGGTWTISMSNALIQPVTGFAIDAWTDARQTVIAQEVPPVEFVSPDGRCILAAKTRKLNFGTWRYEYAILNVDMDRKVGSFSIPISTNTNILSTGFHAVRSHNEPFSNDPWMVSINESSLTWSTTDNPIRWGTLYNFWFTADTPPTDMPVTLGLFDGGNPASVSGITSCPDPAGPVCVVMATPIAEEPSAAKSRYITFLPGNSQFSTAIRVRLKSLMHPPNPDVNTPDFSGFEDQIRWVGPPIEYKESEGSLFTFMGAALQCEPFYTHWSDIDLLHVYGSEIVPSSEYEVQILHEHCIDFLDELNYSEILTIPTGKWGDVIEPYFSELENSAQPDIDDVTAVVAKFLSVLVPLKSHSQLEPNIPDPSQNVSIDSVLRAVDAWLGSHYRFSGPIACE